MADFLVDATTRTYAWFGVLITKGFSLAAQHLKVLEEAQEFAEDQSLEELADVYITVIGALVQNNWTIAQLAVAVDTKMGINENRIWQQKADGTNKHV